jgi:hypothetical protein
MHREPSWDELLSRLLKTLGGYNPSAR